MKKSKNPLVYGLIGAVIPALLLMYAYYKISTWAILGSPFLIIPFVGGIAGASFHARFKLTRLSADVAAVIGGIATVALLTVIDLLFYS